MTGTIDNTELGTPAKGEGMSDEIAEIIRRAIGCGLSIKDGDGRRDVFCDDPRAGEHQQMTCDCKNAAAKIIAAGYSRAATEPAPTIEKEEG